MALTGGACRTPRTAVGSAADRAPHGESSGLLPGPAAAAADGRWRARRLPRPRCATVCWGATPCVGGTGMLSASAPSPITVVTRRRIRPGQIDAFLALIPAHIGRQHSGMLDTARVFQSRADPQHMLAIREWPSREAWAQRDTAGRLARDVLTDGIAEYRFYRWLRRYSIADRPIVHATGAFFRCRTATGATAVAYLLEASPLVHQQPGCVHRTLYQDLDEPNCLLVVTGSGVRRGCRGRAADPLAPARRRSPYHGRDAGVLPRPDPPGASAGASRVGGRLRAMIADHRGRGPGGRGRQAAVSPRLIPRSGLQGDRTARSASTRAAAPPRS